jgi:hypothetical protein
MRTSLCSRYIWPVICVFLWANLTPPLSALTIPTTSEAPVTRPVPPGDVWATHLLPPPPAPLQPLAMRASARMAGELLPPPADPAALLTPGSASVQTQTGSMTAVVDGNDFVAVNRQVQGFQMHGDGFTGVLSRVVPVTKTDAFAGQYSAGPYFLTGTPILPDSETITVNGRTLVRGTDYTLDTVSGALVFTGNQFYGPNDRITGQYAALANSDGSGQLLAMRSSVPVGDALTVGVSHIGFTGPRAAEHRVDGVDVNWQADDHLTLHLQTAKSTGQRVAPPAPAVPVIGEALPIAPGVPLMAQHWRVARAPLQPGTAVLYTPTRTLVRDGDYVINEQTGEVRLLNNAAVLNGQPLSINYTAAPQQTVLTGNGALAAGATYRSSQLTATARFRNVDSGFNPFDGTAAAQPGRSLDWSASYAPAPALTLSTSGATQATPGVAGVNDSRTFGLDFHPRGLPSLALSRSTNVLTATGDRSTTDMLSSTWTLSGITAGLNLSNGTSTGAGGSSATRNATVNLDFQPTDRISASVNVTRNTGENTAPGFAARSTGHGVGASATYKPAKNLVLTVNAQRSTNATVNALDLLASPTLTSGQLGGGLVWSLTRHLELGLSTQVQHDRTRYPAGDPQLPALVPNSATRTRTDTLTMRYAPNERTQVGVSLSQNRTLADTGGAAAASRGRDISATVSLRPADRITLTGTLADTVNNPAQSTGTLPGLRTRTAAASATWQASTSLSLGAAYSANRYQDAAIGVNGAATTAVDVGWHPGGGTNGVNVYAVQQTTRTPGNAATRQHMVGGAAQVSPVKRTTVGVGVQRIWGGSGDAVNTLLQTEGQMRRAVHAASPAATPLNLPGHSLTVVDAVAAYKLDDKHDLTLTGEAITGHGDAGDIRRTAVGIGWHYNADRRLTFSLDGNLVRTKDPSTAGITVKSHEVNAALTWKF